MEKLADIADNVADAAATKEIADGDDGATTDKEPDASGGDSTGESEAKPAGSGEAEDTSGSDESGDGAGEVAEDGDGGEGYIADEGEGEAEVEAEAPAAPTPELQYIVDNLPTIAVRGKTSPEGQVRTFNVKAAGQLPETFEFANAREQAIFTQAIAGQEAEARSLQGKYQTEQTAKSTKEFETKQNAAIRSDIGDLQRSGDLPKYKFEANDSKFATDPAVKTSQEIMDYMNKHNQDEYAAGRTEFISFKTAYKLWKGDQSATVAQTAQDKEDKERKGVTKQLAGSAGAPNESLKKPKAYGSMDELIYSLDSRDFS